ncbi:hypothetical protein C8R30_15311 [Nitrosomonas nitrosa]|uniref:hypothetical protein n=1 Tax=Nitrosomonas nitrosa TaxID=52442 RepID=UPI000D3267A8|nr:hypothetical protein [Nitrosomonas nitrosa]PTQ88354.1 hypothetical protein C8R30_15311 [Nitrosomonas nitrosa]
MSKHVEKATSEEIEKLRSVITDMDSLAQEGFLGIRSIAKLALLSLETPEGHRHIEDVAQALNTIWATAESMGDCVKSRAEDAGCNYTDDSRDRRHAAYMAAMAKERQLSTLKQNTDVANLPPRDETGKTRDELAALAKVS